VDKPPVAPMPRVLLIFEHPTLNGGERSLLAVLPHLCAAGWEVHVWGPQEGPLARAMKGLNAPIVSTNDDDRRHEKLAERREALKRLLSTGNYDLVHANSLMMGRFSGPVVAECGVPSIAHLRDMMRLTGAAVEHLNQHSRILAVSDAVRSCHVKQGLAGEKTHVCYNGVDLAMFRPEKAEIRPKGLRRRLELGDDVRLIGIVGQIILRKGLDVALAAAVHSVRERNDVNVVVIGSRHSEKEETRQYELRLHRIADRYDRAPRVHFVGTVDDMWNIMPELTLLLHTPRQEPLGRVLLEAAACGVPIVATEVGGTREIFPRGEDDGAILIPVDDAAAASFACQRILSDWKVEHALSVRGRQRAEAAFSVERAAAELLRHYEEVALQCRRN
jgi:glycosyltransferase involved in cell wall biosynthesis